jgi:alpha-mannosidase
MMKHLNRLTKRLARSAVLVEYEMERFTSQLKFADFLCEQHHDELESWKELITEATVTVEEAITKDYTSLHQAVRKAEGILAPIGKAAKKYTVYCVGHAHIDMNWMWSWPETVATTNDTFTTVLRLMDEFPQFIFSQSQASVYRIIEQHNLMLLKQIAERVQEGRWEVTASHWVENDKNLSSGESLCRHLLYTRRYMQKLFDLSPEDIPIDWAPDTFGHAHTIPTYLVRGGVKYVYLHRPGAHIGQQPRPQAFWWKAPDDSCVLVRNDMRLGYNGQITPRLVPDSLQSFVQETGLGFTMFVYGVGDHGGGPTQRDLARLVDMDSWPVYPNIKPAKALEFFERLEREGKNLPVIDCELNFEFTGCYTTQSLIKKANRYAEKKLVDAEVANSLAWVCGAKLYPHKELEEAWRDTLFSQFHDILPGSGVHDTRTYTHGLYQKTVAMTGVQETEALRALAAKIDTSSARVEVDEDLPSTRYPRAMGAGIGYNAANGNLSQYAFGKGSDHRPYLVFNPLPIERKEVVEAMVWDGGAWGWELTELGNIRFCVATPDEQVIPAQVIETGQFWGHQFVKLAFPVTIPAFGYGLYVVQEEDGGEVSQGVWQIGFKHHCSYSYYERSPEGIENDLIRLELDMNTGGIRSLVDKRSNIALIEPSQPAPILEYGVERMRSMNAWLIEHTGLCRNLEVVSIKRGLAGPYKATIEAVFRVEQSEFTLTYELRANDPNLYIHIRGTWFQRGDNETGVPVLRFSVPLALKQPQNRYEIPFGAIDRVMKHGEEVPALRWVQVTGLNEGKKAGCLLFNDSKHGHSFEGNRLNLTLIRGSANPDPLPEIGQHEIHLALRPFSGEMPVEKAITLARAFNHELKVVNTDAHNGDLPRCASFAQIEPDNVILDAVKKAEANDALIFRFYESAGRDHKPKALVNEVNTTAKVMLNQDLVGRINQVLEVDLLERPLTHSTAKTDGYSFSVDVPARGITSVLVSFKRG